MFICSTTSNLNNFKPQQLQPQKRVQNEKKKQNRRPQPRKHTKDPTLAPFFFGTMRLFLDCTRGSPFLCFDILQHNGCQKIAKGPPFYIFRHCDTVQKSHLIIFLENFFMSPKGPPFNFFKFFATSWSFTKPEGSLLNFEPQIWRRLWPFSACYYFCFSRNIIVISKCLLFFQYNSWHDTE